MRRLFILFAMLLFVSAFASGAYAVQYIAPSNGANQSIGASNLLYLDNTNARVGIGTASPTNPLNVGATVGNVAKVSIKQVNAFPYNGIWVESSSNNDAIAIGHTGTYGSIHTNYISSGAYTNLALNEYGGNVGIGTTGPGEKLEVAGSVFINAEDSGFVVDASGNKRVGLVKYPGLEGALVHNNNTALRFGQVNNLDVVATGLAAANFTEQMRIDSSGSVGVGTVSPGEKLSVAGNLSTTTGAYLATSSGSVGIGTTAPSNALHVSSASGMRITDPANTYRANLVFGNDGNSWENGIRTYDNGHAEMRIWAENVAGHIYLATGYNGDQATTLPTDGLQVAHNKVAIGVNGNYESGAKFQVNGGVAIGSGYQGTDPGAGNVIISGAVGINTPSPETKLNVAGDATVNGFGRFKGWGADSGWTGLGTEIGVSGGKGEIIAYNRSSATYGALSIDAAGIYLMPNTGGKVGVNDSTPTNTLDVTGSIGVGDTTVIDASRNGVLTSLSTDTIKDSGSTTRMAYSGGNVVVTVG